MSFSRRLRRLLRAQMGEWLPSASSRPPNPDVDAGQLGTDNEEEAPPSGPDGRPVPPDVARAYRALEVPVGSDASTVKKGYRRMMKRYHQDRFANDPDKHDVAGEVSKQLNHAYERVTTYLESTV